MIRKITIRLNIFTFFSVIALFLSTHSWASYEVPQEEGWRWRKSLNIILPSSCENANLNNIEEVYKQKLKFKPSKSLLRNNFHSIDDIHLEMAQIEANIYQQLRVKDHRSLTNIVLANISFLIEDENQNYTLITEVIQNDQNERLVFNSGEEAILLPSFLLEKIPFKSLSLKGFIQRDELIQAVHERFPPNHKTIISDSIVEKTRRKTDPEREELYTEKMQSLLSEYIKNKTKGLEKLAADKKSHDIKIDEAIQADIKNEKKFSFEIEKQIGQIKEYQKNKSDLSKSYAHSEQYLLFFLKEYAEPICQSFLTTYFEDLQDKKVKNIFLHIHSRQDICSECAPSITRECERGDSFASFFKEFFGKIIGEIPTFSILASARQEYNPTDFPPGSRRVVGVDSNFDKLVDPKVFSHPRGYFVQKVLDLFPINDEMKLSDPTI